MTDSELDWPPPFTIKKHPRARYVKLKATERHGLQLIVPPRFNEKHVSSILEENKAWIKKQLLVVETNRTDTGIEVLPEEITFHSLAQTWRITYIATNAKLSLMTRPHQNELVVMGKIENKRLCKKLLVSWIKEFAREQLTSLFIQVSKETRLSFEGLSFRDQQSRWGSCSADKSISLNYKLIFLPFNLLRHVLIHELCHTVHLNHSDQFWQLVESFDVNYKTHKKELKSGDKYITKWITYSF